MTRPIEKRIGRTVLGAVLVTFLVTVAAVIVTNEKLEDALLQLDLQSERDFILENARPNEILLWDTVMLKAYYAPPGMAVDERLPAIFHDLPLPFSGELEIGPATFLITTSEVGGGHFYLAKDITLFEKREDEFHMSLFVLGIFVVVLGVVLTRITSHQLVAPIRRLSQQIRATTPAARMQRVEAQYKDAELQAIAQSFNLFLGELETFFRREQSLMGLASHELRTPIAVIAGALDVIEQRGSIAGASAAPLARIRAAVDEMTTNVAMILKLTRRQSGDDRRERIDLTALADEVRDDLGRHHVNAVERIVVDVRMQAQAHVTADPALVKMLLRNLLGNAVQHTPGRITVTINLETLDVADEGAGLPQAYRDYLNDPQADASELLSLSGLGLFIVSLACERLGWRLQEIPAQSGTRLRIVFADG